MKCVFVTVQFHLKIKINSETFGHGISGNINFIIVYGIFSEYVTSMNGYLTIF